MKVIFVDIDWVLIKFWNTKRKSRAEKTTIEHMYTFDEKLVLNLKQIIKETGAKIVISSSWRHDMERVKKSFLEANLDYNLVVWKTKSNLWYWRWNEVLTRVMDTIKIPCTQWLNLENWVMIDDDDFDAKCVKRLWRFVHTKSNEWLTIEKMKEVINILNS